MMKDNIHTLFLLELAVVVVVERKCENNNLSRMFVCVSAKICYDHIIDEDDKIHTIHFFCSNFFSLSLSLLVYITFWTLYAHTLKDNQVYKKIISVPEFLILMRTSNSH
jgi:hypothetical protein